jgi:hypothetical protein
VRLLFAELSKQRTKHFSWDRQSRRVKIQRVQFQHFIALQQQRRGETRRERAIFILAPTAQRSSFFYKYDNKVAPPSARTALHFPLSVAQF